MHFQFVRDHCSRLAQLVLIEIEINRFAGSWKLDKRPSYVVSCMRSELVSFENGDKHHLGLKLSFSAQGAGKRVVFITRVRNEFCVHPDDTLIQRQLRRLLLFGGINFVAQLWVSVKVMAWILNAKKFGQKWRWNMNFSIYNLAPVVIRCHSSKVDTINIKLANVLAQPNQ